MANIDRQIAIPNYYGPNQHIYVDQLGFNQSAREEARSNVSKEIFLYYLQNMGLDMSFYHIDSDKFYAILSWGENPKKVLELPRDREKSKFVGWQCDSDAREFGEVVAEYDTLDELWDNFKISGKPMDEIITRSYVTALN